MFRSRKLLESVRNIECQLCGKFGETVPAHANWHQYGKGMGMKAHDWAVAALCQSCHNQIDGRSGNLSLEMKHELWQKAWIRTMWMWFEEGVVVVK